MTTIRNGTPFIGTNCFPTPNRELPDFRQTERAQFGQAVRTLQQHFSEIDGFSLFGGGTIDMNELYAAAQGQKGGPEVQQAARFLLSHPELLAELDTSAHGGTPDGKISMGDIETKVSSLDREQQVQRLRYDPRLPEFQQTVSTIAQYLPLLDTAGGFFNFGPDGKISKEDLDAVITGTQYPPELRRAAFFLSMNPDLMGMLDTAAHGGNADGVISAEDIGALSSQLQNVRSALPPPFFPPYRPVYY